MTRPRRPNLARTSVRRPLPRKEAGGRPASVPRTPQLAPPPLQRRQAAGALAGLAAFGLGFAAAGVLVTLHRGGSPAYWCLVTLGLLGIGALGFSNPRSPADAARPPIWSPAGLGSVAEPLGLSRVLVASVFYGLVAVGVLGNVVLPILLGG